MVSACVLSVSIFACKASVISRWWSSTMCAPIQGFDSDILYFTKNLLSAQRLQTMNNKSRVLMHPYTHAHTHRHRHTHQKTCFVIGPHVCICGPCCDSVWPARSRISCQSARCCNNDCFSLLVKQWGNAALYIWSTRCQCACINPGNWLCYVWACRSLCMPTQKDSSKVESCLRGLWEYLHVAISIKT